eukprot:m.510608 g.510608  ORF g.510608 m.510608 type:complete len:304 (+) comp57419_c0_seq8:295-1206(+)
MPTFQSLLNYLALAIVFGGALVYQGQFWEVFRKRWWIYMLLALVDVEANFLIVKAYQYTTMTSIQVLDCFTIPCVIVLGRVVLKTPFSVLKLVAVLICLGGIACLISADVLTSRNEDAGASNAALGDVFCLLGASLYAVSNIGQEGTVKKFSLTEFLSMIGIFGSVVSGIQSGSLESENIASVEWTGPVVGWLLMYSVCLFVLYTVVPVMLLWSDATMMNLGLLTSDAYTLVFGLFLFAYEVCFPRHCFFAICEPHRWPNGSSSFPRISTIPSSSFALFASVFSAVLRWLRGDWLRSRGVLSR